MPKPVPVRNAGNIVNKTASVLRRGQTEVLSHSSNNENAAQSEAIRNQMKEIYEKYPLWLDKYLENPEIMVN